MSSDQSASEVESLSCNYDNLTSNYHNIALLRVPIAEVESDFEMPDNDDDEKDEEDEEEEEDEEQEEEEEVKHSQVIIVLF